MDFPGLSSYLSSVPLKAGFLPLGRINEGTKEQGPVVIIWCRIMP